MERWCQVENDDLYCRYGKLLIQAEILQNQINEVKRQIVEGLRQGTPSVGTPPISEPEKEVK